MAGYVDFLSIIQYPVQKVEADLFHFICQADSDCAAAAADIHQGSGRPQFGQLSHSSVKHLSRLRVHLEKRLQTWTTEVCTIGQRCQSRSFFIFSAPAPKIWGNISVISFLNNKTLQQNFNV